MSTKIKAENTSVTTVAKTSNGTIQLTLTLPWSEIVKTKDKILKDLQKDLTLAGFRKGNVPLPKVEENTPVKKLRELILNVLLPKAFSDAIEANKIRPAMYPRFQIERSENDVDWVIVAKTAEMPVVELGDYKKVLANASGNKIWTPKDEKEKSSEPTKDEKIAKAVNILLDTIKVSIAQVLVDEEVDAKLSKLLERLEKLGISLETYLASNNKRVENLRSEYEVQARRAIATDLILNKIAEEEKLTTTESEIKKTFEDAGGTSMNDSQRRMTQSIILRQKVIDLLANLL